ncbi:MULTISPECIES: hypothetical protein [unclassified Fusibacter]|uniref:hypothetical protein n=1 Tax=unclassified Fusibacter TaxID=2624464 RepID=UPI001010DA2E|nr:MULTISPECIES: hypothetical protein [unclassified Fusibacter]MCK8060243.1 hypothetical protein [Fusibacter sp. A2]NPE23909.1 hypothetical protein [Fusibacter sp. A1]RXV58045.1 hypothetical protein DWB64_19230 [Fusibacter sp. A1]
MNILWGSLMLLIGLFLFVSSIRKSEFIIYKLLVARSKILWGENVHTFFIVVSIVIMGLSSLFFLNIWGN